MSVCVCVFSHGMSLNELFTRLKTKINTWTSSVVHFCPVFLHRQFYSVSFRVALWESPECFGHYRAKGKCTVIIQISVSPPVPWLKLPRNLPWEFKQPLIGCSRETLALAVQLELTLGGNGNGSFLCLSGWLLDILMHCLLQISSLPLTSDLCGAASFSYTWMGIYMWGWCAGINYSRSTL